MWAINKHRPAFVRVSDFDLGYTTHEAQRTRVLEAAGTRTGESAVVGRHGFFGSKSACAKYLAVIRSSQELQGSDTAPFFVDGICTLSGHEIDEINQLLAARWYGLFFLGAGAAEHIQHSYTAGRTRALQACLGPRARGPGESDPFPPPKLEWYEALNGSHIVRRSIAGTPKFLTLAQVLRGHVMPALVRLPAGHAYLSETLTDLLAGMWPRHIWISGLKGKRRAQVEEIELLLDGYGYIPFGSEPGESGPGGSADVDESHRCSGTFTLLELPPVPSAAELQDELVFYTQVSSDGMQNLVFPRFFNTGSSTLTELIARQLKETHFEADAMIVDEYVPS